MTTRSLRRRREREELDPRDPVASPEVLALADLAGLAGRGGHVARVAAARAAQQGLGNHATSRVLARDPNPALEQRRTPRPPKPKLRSGREVDAIFDASPYMKELIGAKLNKGAISKAMKIDDEAEFERAWIAYAKRSHNPETDAGYTEKEARDYLAREGVRAFQDEDGGEVHIRKERSDLGTQLHEGMHLFADDRWRKRMGYNVNEGVTEFFTRKLGPEVQVERDDSSFLRQFTSVTHLVIVAGEPAVASAYFDGDVAGLKAAVDGRKLDGKGTWDRWLGLLDAGDFKGANALMKS
jgi:hypothetical protein